MQSTSTCRFRDLAGSYNIRVSFFGVRGSWLALSRVRQGTIDWQVSVYWAKLQIEISVSGRVKDYA